MKVMGRRKVKFQVKFKILDDGCEKHNKFLYFCHRYRLYGTFFSVTHIIKCFITQYIIKLHYETALLAKP